MAGIRKIDFIDKITLPIFAATMVWEHRVLQKRQLRELVDVNAVAELVQPETNKILNKLK